eukprot:g14865.t1
MTNPRQCTIALVSALLLTLSPVSWANDWPGFQGPKRDGTVPDAKVLTDWPETGPAVRWTVEVAPGFGGAAVVGGSVYLLDRDGIQGDTLRSINLQTGEENEAIGYDAPGRLSYDGARSTPTVEHTAEDQSAYTVGPLGHVTCFDLIAQKIHWQKHMEDFGADPPKWGWSQSPLIIGDVLIVQPMTDDAGLVALDKSTGQVAWKSRSIGKEGYASPRLIELAGVPQLVTFTSTRVSGLDPKTGDIFWSYDNIPVKRAIPTPAVVGDNKLFITAGYDSGSALIEINQQDGVFSVKELMRDKEHGGQVHSALPVNGHLFVNLNTNENLRQRGKRAHGLGCFDLNGKLVWKSDNQPDLNRGAIIALGEYLIALGGEDGVLRLIKADQAQYEELAASKVFEADQGRNMIWAPMAFADGLLLVRSQSELKCLDLRHNDSSAGLVGPVRLSLRSIEHEKGKNNMDSRSKTTRYRLRAFSLIELLVVIAVISILIAMLMPALASTKDAARNVICMANLQQMGVSTHTYAEDHRGQVPDLFFNFSEGSDYVLALTGPKSDEDSGLDQYLDEVLICPMDKDPAPVVVVEPDNTVTMQAVSYGVNADILIRDQNIHLFEQPCKITMFFDGLMSDPVDQPNYLQGQYPGALELTRSMVIRRHNKLANCLYLDNHVAPFTELTSTMLANGGNTYAVTGDDTTAPDDDSPGDDDNCRTGCDPDDGGRSSSRDSSGKSSGKSTGCNPTMKTYRSIVTLLALGLLLALTARPASASQAPDFPPGVFTDGKQYSLENLRGQAVVLFFFEQRCPGCAKKLPEYNALFEKYKDKPVTFIGISSKHDSNAVAAYIKRIGLEAPVFVDKISMMEKQYKTNISLQNVFQARVIDANGKIVGFIMDEPTINRALSTASVKRSAYDAKDYNEALKPVVELLNNDEHKDAMRGLGRFLRDRDEAIKTSAEALNEAVLAQAQGWVEQADGLVETDPFEARSLYTKASDLFPREPFAKDVRKKIADLRSNPLFKDESAARKMYAKMVAAIDKMKPKQAPELVAYAKQIAEKYPDTPTGQRCAKIADNLGS